MVVRVKGLHIYPIKSCKGIDISIGHLSATGFAFDRQWMVVRQSDGKFVTQRQEPRLALVTPELPQAALDAAPGGSLPIGLKLRITAPGQDPLEVPLDPPGSSATFKESTVWEWRGPAADQGDAAAAWFTSYLGKEPVRLVRYAGRPGEGDPKSNPTRRPTDAMWAPVDETAFSDGFPYLLISEASLEELNRQTGDAGLRMNRFRPNIVVTGNEPFAEDSLRIFSLGDVEFEAVKPCSRCKITTTEQETAKVGDEPLDTLSTFRSGSKLGWAEAAAIKSWKHSVYFGQNLVSRQATGSVSVGDEMTLKQSRATAKDGTLLWQPHAAAAAS